MSTSQPIINVLVTIDAETILEKFGRNNDPNRPTWVSDSSLIYMTTRQNQLGSNPGSELVINASPGNIIQWRQTTLSGNSLYTGILYRFNALSGGDLITPPQPVLVTLKEPLPNARDPLSPATQVIKSYFWSCYVEQTGSVTYNFSFMILNQQGEKQGYYYWDPYINIKD